MRQAQDPGTRMRHPYYSRLDRCCFGGILRSLKCATSTPIRALTGTQSNREGRIGLAYVQQNMGVSPIVESDQRGQRRQLPRCRHGLLATSLGPVPFTSTATSSTTIIHSPSDEMPKTTHGRSPRPLWPQRPGSAPRDIRIEGSVQPNETPPPSRQGQGQPCREVRRHPERRTEARSRGRPAHPAPLRHAIGVLIMPPPIPIPPS